MFEFVVPSLAYKPNAHLKTKLTAFDIALEKVLN